MPPAKAHEYAKQIQSHSPPFTTPASMISLAFRPFEVHTHTYTNTHLCKSDACDHVGYLVPRWRTLASKPSFQSSYFSLPPFIYLRHSSTCSSSFFLPHSHPSLTDRERVVTRTDYVNYSVGVVVVNLHQSKGEAPN